MTNTKELSYCDYDFDSLVLELSNRVKASAAWKDAYRSGTGQMLMELYGYVGNLILFYLERRAEEGYIQTAKNRSSIINLARLVDYFPTRAVSATGTVTFTIPTAHTKNIYFPQYTILKTVSGTQYLVSTDSVLLAGSTTVDASIVQGIKVDIEVASSGVTDQEYKLNYTDIEDSNLFVYVNNILWTEVRSFITGTPTSQWYKVRAELDDTLTLVFGDNVTGQSPSAGDTILIRFIRSDGVSGNAYSAGTIATLDSFIYDSDGTKITNVTVANADSVLGGDDIESTEEIRNNAPNVFAAGERCVTRADYIAIIGAYPSVATINAWGENEESAPNYTMFNRVKLCMLLQDWTAPNTDFKSALALYLQDYAMITVKYTYATPVILDVIVSTDVFVIRGYNLDNTQAVVENTVGEDFVLGTTTKLGVSKRISDLIHAIDGATGVSYCHPIYYIYKEPTLGYNSFHDYGCILEAVPIKETTAKVYVNTTQIAVDDGANGWTSMGITYTTTGDIDYVTGVVGLDIAPPLGVNDVLSIQYEQNEGGDIVVLQDQICKLKDTVITNIAYDTNT